MTELFTAIPYLPREACFVQITTLLPTNPVIVEAGAFTGSDTRRFAKQWPHGVIHTFEPIPSLFEQLIENTRPFINVTCYQLALGSKNGTAQLHVAEKHAKPGIPSQASSLLAPREQATSSKIHFPTSITVPVTTLDAWATLHAITDIDLLWLDLQGIELDVLKASPTILTQISVIVLETATIERYESQPLAHEIISWMQSHGFEPIARDFDGVDTKFGNIVFKNQTYLTPLR